MMAKQNNISSFAVYAFGTVAFVAALVGAAWLFLKDEKTSKGNTIPAVDTSADAVTDILKLGSTGPNVVRLQHALNHFYKSQVVPISGIYDERTAAKVLSYTGRLEPVYMSTIESLEKTTKK